MIIIRVANIDFRAILGTLNSAWEVSNIDKAYDNLTLWGEE